MYCNGLQLGIYEGKIIHSQSTLSEPWNPDFFSLMNEHVAKRPKVREPPGTHIRSFELCRSNQKLFWGFWVRFWLGNFTNGFWLVGAFKRPNLCAQRFSRTRGFAPSPASLPHAHLWARKPLGSTVLWVKNFFNLMVLFTLISDHPNKLNSDK